MIETDWYEEFEYAKEPVVVFQDGSIYVNGVEIKLGKYIHTRHCHSWLAGGVR